MGTGLLDKEDQHRIMTVDGKDEDDSKLEVDDEEKQLLEQMNHDREIEKQYQKQSMIIPSCS